VISEEQLAELEEAHGTAILDLADMSDRAHAAEAEVESLLAWKESAMRVLAEWDLVHDALGRPGRLGDSKAAASLAAVKAGAR
jgi:hypothetical protein